MWREKSLIPFMAKEMPSQKFIFVKPEHAEITGFFYDNVDRIEDMSQTEFFAALSDKAGAEASLALMEEEGIEAGGAMINDCMRTINLEYLKHLYEKHRFAAEKLERMGDDGYLRELAESQRIKDEINKLYSKDRK
jgi:DNA primase